MFFWLPFLVELMELLGLSVYHTLDRAFLSCSNSSSNSSMRAWKDRANSLERKLLCSATRALLLCSVQWLKKSTNDGPNWNRNKLGTAARSCSYQLLKLDNKICLLLRTNILANIFRWLKITIRFARAQFAARCELPGMSKFAPSKS